LDASDRVDMPLDEMAVEPVADAECALEVDGVALRQPAERRARYRLRRDHRLEPARPRFDDGQADAVHRDARAARGRLRERRADPQADLLRPAAARLDATHSLDDPGEHRLSSAPAPTRCAP